MQLDVLDPYKHTWTTNTKVYDVAKAAWINKGVATKMSIDDLLKRLARGSLKPLDKEQMSIFAANKKKVAMFEAEQKAGVVYRTRKKGILEKMILQYERQSTSYRDVLTFRLLTPRREATNQLLRIRLHDFTNDNCKSTPSANIQFEAKMYPPHYFGEDIKLSFVDSASASS